ncbi:MAG: aminodeoxychorismate synthase component I [Pseudomonadota bacterium]
MVDIDAFVGGISGVWTTPFELKEPFIDFAGRFAARPGTVVLMSGTNSDCARYHILGVNPWLRLRACGAQITLVVDDNTFTLTGDPFDILQAILRRLRLPAAACRGIGVEEGADALPVMAGLLGYLSYDLKDVIEELPRTSVDDLRLPHLYMVAPSVILIHDKEKRVTRLCIPERTGVGDFHSVLTREMMFRNQARQPRAEETFEGNIGRAKAGVTRDGYMAAVDDIKDYIRAGHVYQVNLSQRFEMAFKGDSYRLFQRLYAMNPAPFFAYIHAEDHTIVSTSPERFMKLSGTRVETRPIKGTRPRGRSPAADEAFRQELLTSRKDDAELSMIVDLLRNDIGKVCSAGSVRVTEHKRIEAYRNVYHLVSIVEGILLPGRDAVDLIRATFPGGSITGCPKIRAMEIIDELEPTRRHIYTGSIGYISFHDTMDLSIAIRTATVLNGRLVFSVGGGIVFDSNPADEYEETLHKGQTLMTVLKASEKKERDEKDAAAASIVWLNGALQPLEEARVPVLDQGLLYGYGFFETIRVAKGHPRLLQLHLDRFERTWSRLFETSPPDLSWADIIARVLHRNGLTETIAAVKILATRGDREMPPYNYQLLVTARAYTHRLEGNKEAGLRLAVYPEARLTPLADHKTTNYLYYLKAGHWAKAQGADEALILNPDGSVSETNTAGILAVRGRTVIQPVSDHVLPSIMQQQVCGRMADWGYTVQKRRLMPRDLMIATEVLMVNSLMGAVPVFAIDTQKMKVPSDLFARINREVL